MPKIIHLFKAALGNETYLTQVNKNTHTQLSFIEDLEKNKFTPPDLLELIQSTSDPQIRTLLIVRLLSQSEYLANLQGESILCRLANKQAFTKPSRLNAWIHQLDITLLTPELINKLEPEAAISILCSIPHFHQLTAEQVKALLYKNLSRELIFYWVKHYAALPNAHYVLAHLMKLVHTEVINAIEESNKKAQITANIIKHLHLFHPLYPKFLTLANQESHLILAMKRYLNGHNHQAYSLFITQLINHLLHMKHTFSLEAIELLASLEEIPEIESIKASAITLINTYLRTHLTTNALKGNIRPLYGDDGRFNMQKMVQSTQLHLENTNIQNIHDTQLIPEHTINAVKELIAKHQAPNFFEYFLIHYCGDKKPVEQALNDYLQQCIKSREHTQGLRIIQRLIFLLSCNQLDSEIKDTMFSVLLEYSNLYNEQTIQQLFLYNATATLQHFGMQGGKHNYQRVYHLASWALSDPASKHNQSLHHIAQQAQVEAAIELKFCEKQGLFSSLIKYIKRCWIYGWTGFFLPKKPVYVLPESIAPKQTVPYQSSLSQEPPHPPEQNLYILLQEMNPLSAVTQVQLEKLIKALGNDLSGELSNNEFDIRIRMHKLYRYVIAHQKPPQLYDWLKFHQEPFWDNHFRLIELSLQRYPQHETNKLIKQIKDKSNKLIRIAEEFNCALPEPKDTLIPLQNNTANAHTTATETLSEYSEFFIKTAQSTCCWLRDGIHNTFFAKDTPEEYTPTEMQWQPPQEVKI